MTKSRLQRKYAIGSSIVFASVLIALMFYFGSFASRLMLDTLEERNSAFANLIATRLTTAVPEHFSADLKTKADVEVSEHLKHYAQLDEIVAHIVGDRPVPHIHVYRERLTVYSTDRGRIGEIMIGTEFQEILENRASSRNHPRRGLLDWLVLSYPESNTFTSYVPIHFPVIGEAEHANVDSPLIVEVQVDISANLAAIRRTQIQLAASAIVLFALYFCFMILMARRADRTIGDRHLELQRTIEDLELAEKTIRTSHRRFQDFVESSSDFLWEMDKNLRFTWFSSTMTRITGVPEEKILGQTREATGMPEIEPALWESHLADLAAHRQIKGFTHPRKHPDGKVVWLSIDAIPIYDGDGNFVGYRGTGRDVTEARTADVALRDSETRLREMARIAQVGHFDWNEETRRLVSCSEVFASLFGRTVAEFEAECGTVDWLREAVHPDDRDAYIERIESATQESPEFQGDFRIVGKNDEVRYVRERGVFSYDADGNRVRSFGTMQDITNEMQWRESLARSERRLARAQKTAKIGDWEWDEINQQMVDCSDQLPRIFGKSKKQFLENGYTQINDVQDVHDEDRERYRDECERFLEHVQNDPDNPQPFDITIRIVRADGEIRYVREIAEPVFDGNGNLSHTIGTTQDVTEQQLLELQLRETQKLEALGLMTGGVTHEFNNVLQVVTASIELAALQYKKGIDPVPTMMRAMGAGLNGGELTGRLLAYLGKSDSSPETLDVKNVVENATLLLKPLLGEHITIVNELSNDLWPVFLDKAQLETALLNLAINASHAMPNGGTLTFTAENIDASTEPAANRQSKVATNEFVRLSVRDTGTGMSPDVLQRAFDPFFTTKKSVKGTGLGLSMVYGFVVRQCNGNILIESEEGTGTEIHLEFPKTGKIRLRGADAEQSVVSLQQEQNSILVVEDEPAVLETACLLLVELGFRVLKARDGDEALEVLKISDPPAFLLSDIVMPSGMDGTALAEIVRKEYPDIRIALMSGYPSSELADRGIGELDAPLLQKPFRKDDLAATLRKLERAA